MAGGGVDAPANQQSINGIPIQRGPMLRVIVTCWDRIAWFYP